MTSEDLESFITARPFKTFAIGMNTGRTIEISDPRMIAHAGGAIAVVVYQDNRIDVVQLPLVESLANVQAAAKATPEKPLTVHERHMQVFLANRAKDEAEKAQRDSEWNDLFKKTHAGMPRRPLLPTLSPPEDTKEQGDTIWVWKPQ